MRIWKKNGDPSPRISLGEGHTPLVESTSQTALAGSRLLFKLESCNPTGSYKDRFVATEVDRMIKAGVHTCIGTSSGNTGSSLATYSARYGLKCVVIVNQDAPKGKLVQMQAHGARVVRIPGFVSDAGITSTTLALLQELSEHYFVPLVVSAFRYCPEGMHGVQRIASELSAANPDHIFVPVGGAGLYSAIVQGFIERQRELPRIHAVQPEGCLTLVASYLNNTSEIRSVHSTTRISGLSVPTDLDASRGLRLLHKCNGTGIAVSDAEVFSAQRTLVEREGIYCEPAGATAFAGWIRAIRDGMIGDAESSVCIVTGHGFKDPASISQLVGENLGITVNVSNLAETLKRLIE
jgi:threonine synthase